MEEKGSHDFGERKNKKEFIALKTKEVITLRIKWESKFERHRAHSMRKLENDMTYREKIRS